MNREEVYARLTVVFREVFDNETIEINDATTASDIEDWDSFGQINLILAVEDEFCFKFPMGKISTMKNVEEMVNIIQSNFEERKGY